MAEKKERNYRVERVPEENEQNARSYTEDPIPMVEINGSGVALAFLVLICAAGFAVYLLHRIVSGVGIGTMIGCLLVVVVLIAAIIGMIATTVAEFRKDKHRLRLILTVISFFTALCIGAVIGMSMPV
jgi:hypothetical protein